jgi:hypothetical protein
MIGPGTFMPGNARRRRFAAALVRHAARMMPREQQRWADAMQNEIAYVPNDGDACRWALGCVCAAFVARLRALYLLDVALVRYGGVLLATFLAFDALFATALTLAYRLGAFGTAEGLAGMTAGDDYQRLIPLMEGIPAWVHVIAIAGGACYLVAVACLLRRHRAAQIALLLGVGIHVVGDALVRPIIAAIGVAAVPDPSFLAAVLLPIVSPLLLSLAARSGSRARPDAAMTG